MAGRNYLQNIENLNERTIEEYYTRNALKGFFILIAVFWIDSIYCRILESYYANPDYFFSHMRGGIAITFSLLFGIADILISSYILYNARYIKGIGIQMNAKGLKIILLKLLSLYVVVISIVSILYDIYEIIFVHLLGVAL